MIDGSCRERETGKEDAVENEDKEEDKVEDER